MFRLGQSYTRREIHQAVGGSVQSYLPTVDGRVVAACLRRDTNPDAPFTILPGTGPGIEGAAARLVARQAPVPTFLKRGVGDWEFVGEFAAAHQSFERDEIRQHSERARREDVTSVIHMRRTDR